MTIESLPARSLKHINVLDPLRGLAALAVVVFHYSGSILPTLRPNMLSEPLEYGRYGVHVFFVISGFVIPYSMYRAGYTLEGFGRFMARRIVRIAPPAYIAACLVILFHLAAVWITGREVNTGDWPGVNARSILGNLFFHPHVFDTKWFNFPYWTLMIEFQFYFLIGLVLPLLIDPNKIWRTVMVVSGMLLMTIVQPMGFLVYSPFFMLGVIIFLWKQELIGKKIFIALSVSALALTLMHDVVSLGVALATTGIILWEFEFKDNFTSWLGRISYSLYIMHVPVGYFSETALKRVIDLHEYEAGRVFLLFFYTALALLASHIFYRIVELPCIQLAKRMQKEPNA